MNEVTLVKISGWFWAILPVTAGSIYSFISGRQKLDSQELSPFKSWVAFIVGTFIAFIISKAIIEKVGIEPLSYYSYSIQILCGLFLIQVISESFKQIPKFFEAIRVKFLGN